jgi:hypothetical protein
MGEELSKNFETLQLHAGYAILAPVCFCFRGTRALTWEKNGPGSNDERESCAHLCDDGMILKKWDYIVIIVMY